MMRNNGTLKSTSNILSNSMNIHEKTWVYSMKIMKTVFTT